jgi:hypothetical protein
MGFVVVTKETILKSEQTILVDDGELQWNDKKEESTRLRL